MTNKQLVTYCSPTLAGLKTGSLFNCSLECPEGDCGDPRQKRRRLVAEFRELNRMLSPKGLRVIPLRIRPNSVLTYLYRPAELERDFEDPQCRQLLDDLGYEGLSIEQSITRLRIKLQHGEEFPHEVGLFLGYPAEDVRGFIEERADRCKCTGCWKVYGDVQAAKELFARYDCCTACYLRQLAAGTPLDRLAVAVPA